jgi:putative hydrolase of the HAD superfamily
VICSNWDWDLREAVDEARLTDAVDVMVSSAWVGARKPHPRIYAQTLAEAGVGAAGTLFVGDTWGPDVAGPLAAGLSPLYLRRADHWPDGTCPHPDLAITGVPVIADLRGLVDHLGSTAVA